MTFWSRDRGYRIAALAIVLAAAVILRLWRLDSIPPGLYHDEAYNGLDALSLTQGAMFPQFYEGWELYAADAHEDRPVREGRWPVFFEGNYGREPMHIYLMAVAIQVFGANVFAIRVVPALAGITGVLTTYLAARELTGRPDRGQRKGEERSPWRRVVLDPALIAALATAILFPAVHFSRFGIRAMLFVPLATITVALFWRGINRVAGSGEEGTGRVPLWGYFAAAGLFLGLGLYSYAAARLFPLVFILFVSYWFWQDREAFGQHWGHVAVMASAAFLTALPLLLFFARYPYYFAFRIAYVANRGIGAVEGKPWLTWLGNVGRVARGLFLLGETHLRHNLPGRPFLDPLQSILFLSGAVVTISQRLRQQWVFLWIWLLVMLLPSILSGDAPHFGRLIGAAPVLAIFIGLGWLGIVQFVMKRVAEPRRSLALGVFGVLLMASAVWTIVDYFGRYAGHSELADAFHESDWQLGVFLAGFPAESNLYLTPAQEELATIYFALEGSDRLTNFTGRTGFAPVGVPGRSSLYAVRPWSAEYIRELETLLPSGRKDSDTESYLTYLVDGEEKWSLLLNQVEVNWSDEIRLVGWQQGWQREQLVVRLLWKALSDMDLDYTAFVHVLDERGELVTQGDRPPIGYPSSHWREGELVLDTFVLDLPAGYFSAGAETELTLQTGFYDLATLNILGRPAVLGRIELDIRQ